MVDDEVLREWFCREVLPLERPLLSFIRRNWRDSSSVVDLRQDIYAKVLEGAKRELPLNAGAFVFTVARNHLINCAKRARVVSMELVADLDSVSHEAATFLADRILVARDELRRAHMGLEQLPPRCREIVRLRKVEGHSTRETAMQLGVTIDTVEKQLTLGMRALTNFMLGGSGKIKRPIANRLRRGKSSNE